MHALSHYLQDNIDCLMVSSLIKMHACIEGCHVIKLVFNFVSKVRAVGSTHSWSPLYPDSGNVLINGTALQTLTDYNGQKIFFDKGSLSRLHMHLYEKFDNNVHRPKLDLK